MPHLSCSEQLRLLTIYQTVKKCHVSNKAKQTLKIARECYGIKLGYPCFYELLKKWRLTGGVKDATKANLHQRLVSDRGLLAIEKELLRNPFLTCLQLKYKLGLVASLRTIRDCCSILGWKKVNTKYCQIVSPINRIKRFIYASCCKIFNEKYADLTVIDETTIEVRLASYKNWRKPSDMLSRAAGGKIGKLSCMST